LQITPQAPPETSFRHGDPAGNIESANSDGVLYPIAGALAEVTASGKGDMLMKTGDLIIARQFYSRAFQSRRGRHGCCQDP
jgi:hypothetical protein